MKAIKIFSNLFLLLCIASLGVTVALTFLRENEKVKRIEVEQKNEVLQAEKKALNSQVTSLEGENQKIGQELEIQTGVTEDLRKQLDNEKQQVTLFKSQAEQSLTQLTLIQKEYEEYKTSSADLIEDYKQRNKELTDKIRDLERDMKRKRTSSPAISYREMKRKEPSKVREVREKSVELEPVVVKPERNFSGRIMVINRKFNFVIANIGKKDGLEIGDQLTVFRNGQRIALVEVEKIYDALSASGILEEDPTREIREGDVIGT